jgi:hypothetical protein
MQRARQQQQAGQIHQARQERQASRERQASQKQQAGRERAHRRAKDPRPPAPTPAAGCRTVTRPPARAPAGTPAPARRTRPAPPRTTPPRPPGPRRTAAVPRRPGRWSSPRGVRHHPRVPAPPPGRCAPARCPVSRMLSLPSCPHPRRSPAQVHPFAGRLGGTFARSPVGRLTRDGGTADRGSVRSPRWRRRRSAGSRRSRAPAGPAPA